MLYFLVLNSEVKRTLGAYITLGVGQASVGTYTSCCSHVLQPRTLLTPRGFTTSYRNRLCLPRNLLLAVNTEDLETLKG